jgi:TonB family protein
LVLKMMAALGLAAAVAAPALADSPPMPAKAATSSAPQPSGAPPSPSLAFYPPNAKAAGVEGKAVIRCSRSLHLALQGCTLVSETPAGQGFGAAALAMAAKSPENPNISLDDASLRGPQPITVTFSLHPSPKVSPDLTAPGHLISRPSLVSGPTPAQLQAAYPARALADQVDGEAVIGCLAMKDGKLSACSVLGESPPGYGFGQAALDVAADFVVKPAEVDNRPVDNISISEVSVPVVFAHDPAAPLSLPSPPGGK